MVFGKGGDPANIIEQSLLDDHIANLMGTAATFDFAVGGTYEVFFAVFPSTATDLVQLCTAVGSEQHTGKHGHFPHRRDPAPPITNLLHDLKHRLVNNGFVGILENAPFGRVIVHLLLVFVRLAVGLEIDCVTDILHPGKDVRNRGISPQIRVIAELPCRRIHAHPLGMGSGIFNFTLCEDIGNLRRPISVHAQLENLTHYLGCSLVHYPMVLIIRVFGVAVWWLGTQRFAGFALCLEHRTDFLTGILGVKFM